MTIKMKTTLNIKTVAIAATAIALLNTSCKKDHWYECKRANGHMTTEVRSLESFDEIELTESGDVYLFQDSSASTYRIEIEASDNIMDRIKTKVSGDRLTISTKCIRGKSDRSYKIYVPDVTKVTVSGSGNIITETAFNVNALKLGISGSGSINFSGKADDLTIDISGSGDVKLSGSTTVLDLNVSGSGSISSFSMPADECMVSISGSGNCEVYVNKILDVSISGSGSVVYDGSPEAVNVSSSGSGTLTKR